MDEQQFGATPAQEEGGIPLWGLALGLLVIVGAVVGLGLAMGWFGGGDEEEEKAQGGEAQQSQGTPGQEASSSSASSSASTTPPPPPPPPVIQNVTFYQHYDYGGTSSSLGVGRYDINAMGLPNDAISSVKVPAGMRVILYEHGGFGGATRILTADTPQLGPLDFNDKTSSIVVETVSPQQSSGQRFYIRHSSGKCVHALGGSATPGNDTKLVYHDGCDGARLQFSLTPEGTIRHSSGKCLHPSGGSATPANNTALVFWDGCNEQRLRFELTPGGSIRHVTSGKCVHPRGGSGTPANNTELVLHDGCDEPRLAHTLANA
jgi:hypothetical protein